MSEVAISVTGLRKTYGALAAVDGIDLEIQRGEVFALLGPNGAGKSTTIEILEGFRKRTAGEVLVLGHDPQRADRAFRERVGLMLQTTSGRSSLSARESLTYAARLYPHPRGVDEVLELVGLSAKANAKPQTLSGGQRRRLDVATAMIGRPELVFLDEPTTGFDPEARRQFWDLIESLRDDGTTVMLTTHYLDEADRLADRIGVVSHGKLVALDTPAGLRSRAKNSQVSWREGETIRVESTSTPSAFMRDLLSRYGGEIPGLTLTHPSLEDVYVEMVNDTTADAGTDGATERSA